MRAEVQIQILHNTQDKWCIAQLKNVKNSHGGALLLVKLLASGTLLHGYLLHFLNCTNDINLRKASQYETSREIQDPTLLQTKTGDLYGADHF